MDKYSQEDYETLRQLAESVRLDRRTELDPTYSKPSVHSGEHLPEQLWSIVGVSHASHMFHGERQVCYSAIALIADVLK